MGRAFALGLLVGFPIAASPGPIFFLILRRTLARGWRSGLVSGLGVATGDATYAALAAFGVSLVTSFLVGQRRWIGLFGGLALALIGLRTILTARGVDRDDAAGQKGVVAGTYVSSLAVTLSNPPTILSFTAVFAGLGLHASSGWRTGVALVAGVLLGSAGWWILLTAAASLVRERLTRRVTQGIGIAAGLALIGFGVVSAGIALRG